MRYNLHEVKESFVLLVYIDCYYLRWKKANSLDGLSKTLICGGTFNI